MLSFKDFITEVMYGKPFDAKELLKDLSRSAGRSKLTKGGEYKVTVIPRIGNQAPTDNGVVPLLKAFSRNTKTKTITVNVGDEVVIVPGDGIIYGATDDYFYKGRALDFKYNMITR